MEKRKGEQRHISYKLEQNGMKLVCTHIVVCTCVCTRRTEVSAVCLSQLSSTSKLIIILIYLVTHLFIFKCTCGSQRTNSGHQFSHAMGVGIELRFVRLGGKPLYPVSILQTFTL